MSRIFRNSNEPVRSINATASLARQGMNQVFRSLLATVVLMASSLSVYGDDGSDRPGLAMANAASRLSATLSPELQKKLSYAYDDPERVNWQFIPKDRNGIVLWDLEGEARRAAEDLVKAGLSSAGYAKTLEVRSLEEVLYLFEAGEEEYRRQRRHPHKYHVTVFGTPGPTGLWGWRFEGHHLSLNFSIKDGVVVSSTPEFFGANPGLINGGPGRNLRVLGRREDLARDILKSCSDDQKKKMWISETAPDEIRGPGVVQPIAEAAVGLAYSDMSPDQQKLLKELIAEYLAAMPVQVVRDRLKAIDDGGIENVRIGWWGQTELNQRHHYVVQGPSFIIEYNNTQNEANHVHAMWRNLGGDFYLPAAAKP